MEVAGEIGIFEGQKACAPLRKHLLGWRRFMPVIYLVIYMVALFGLSALLDRFAPQWILVGILLFMAVSLFAWLRYSSRLGPKAFLERGVPAQTPVAFRIEDGGLMIVGPVSETRLSWAGISQIAPGKLYWLFIGPGLSYFLPRRFFADRAAEATFMRDCFTRLSPEAQARSGQITTLQGR